LEDWSLLTQGEGSEQSTKRVFTALL